MQAKYCYILIIITVILGACGVNKDLAPSGATDAKPDAVRSAAQSAFAGLDNDSTPLPVELPLPKQNMTVGSMPASQTTSQAGMLVTVEIDTFKVFNDTVSLKDAENQMRSFVRELALDNALPYDVSLTGFTSTMYVDRNDRFDESVAKSIFMMSSSAGRFVKEEFLDRYPTFDTRNHTFSYRMHYRAQILPLEKVYNPSMTMDVKISETLLHSGEQFSLSITPNTDGYLYIFNFLSDQSVVMVFPRQDMQDNQLVAGQPWKQNLSAVCDPDKDFIIETLYMIFSADKIAGWEAFQSNRNEADLVFSTGEESFILFNDWLAKSDPARRLEKMAQLHIYR